MRTFRFRPKGKSTFLRANPRPFLRSYGAYNPGSVSTPTPAVFENFLAYKNGVKGAATQNTGRIVFSNFTVADNGAGPQAPVVNGKDNGGGIEFSFIADNRNRANTPLSAMAGIQTALIVARTALGQVGTAGYWPSSRGIRGIITTSSPQEVIGAGSFMSVTNALLSGWTGSQFVGLEACATCRPFTGGFATYFQGTTFVNPSISGGANVANWTWAHQGLFIDTDAAMLGNGVNALIAAYNPLLAADGCSTAWSGVGNGAVCGTAGGSSAIIQKRVVINNQCNMAYYSSNSPSSDLAK